MYVCMYVCMYACIYICLFNVNKLNCLIPTIWIGILHGNGGAFYSGRDNRFAQELFNYYEDVYTQICIHI